jgi:glycosyltransferase involved in cell wall biosynthesis
LAVRISGFTFIRNGNELGYPFVESIKSLLPLCDEIVVNVPASTDGTLEKVKQIGDARIRVLESEWDETMRTGGRVMSHHTNLALRECRGDWCVYIQGDEVLHEDSIPAMRRSLERELENGAVQGLLVDYTHFYGSYWTTVYSFGWYYREVRVVRRDPTIQSVGDAQGFRTRGGDKLRVKVSGGQYYHYGFALHPRQMHRKKVNLAGLYGKASRRSRPAGFYDDDQKVRPFQGTHPSVMRELVAAADWTYQSRSPLIRFRRNYFWEDMALLLKRCTGLTIGVHKNYRLIR